MKIQNNNTYSIMYGMEFIKAGEVADVNDKTAKLLLNHPNVVEYVSKEQVANLENENKKLKEELAKVKETKSKAVKAKAK